MWNLTNPHLLRWYYQAVGYKYKPDTIYFCSLVQWHLIALYIFIFHCLYSNWILQTTNRFRLHSHCFSWEMVALVQIANREQLFTNRPCSHYAVWLHTPVTPSNMKTSSETCTMEMNVTLLSPSIRKREILRQRTSQNSDYRLMECRNELTD